MREKPQDRKSRFSILMICPQFRPIVGGYERAAERLSIALTAMGHRVIVITERRQTAWARSELTAGFEIRRLWCIYRKRLHAVTSIFAFSIFLLVHGKAFDIWHVHQYGLHSVLATALGKFMRRPVVLKLTSSGTQGLPRTMESLPLRGFCSWIQKKVDAVVATTCETANEAVAFGINPCRVHIVGNPIDTNVFYPRSEEDKLRLRGMLGIASHGVVLFVGRFTPEKNLFVLLKAWQIALSQLKEDWILVLVGDGPMRGEMERWAKQNDLTSYILFAGFQSNVESWMAASDIFVIPSQNEGLSNAMLEAMATGLPIVASEVSGTTGIDRCGAGIVVPRNNQEMLASTLTKLAKNKEKRKKMGFIARSIVEEEFAIPKVAQKYVLLYQKVINSPTYLQK